MVGKLGGKFLACSEYASHGCGAMGQVLVASLAVAPCTDSKARHSPALCSMLRRALRPALPVLNTQGLLLDLEARARGR